MSLYHKYVEGNIGAHTPRIVGLTATINKKKIRGDITEGRIALEVKDLERKMAAKAFSNDDMGEVRRYSTASTVKRIEYSLEEKEEWAGLLDGIKSLHDFISSQRRRRVTLTSVARQALQFSNFSSSTVFAHKCDEIKKELLRTIMDFEDIYLNIGPLGCAELVGYKLECLNQLQSKMNVDQYDLLNIGALRTQLYHFHVKLDKRMQTWKLGRNVGDLKNFVSHKIEALLSILNQYREKEDSEEQLLGLVFVKRRSFAAGVKAILELMAETDPASYGFIKSELITGVNHKRKDARDARVSVADQKNIIDAFRRKQINLIICTTVLEEGIDIPCCNLVVRFDEIYAYTSFIQSMGRARKAGARFFVLISTEDKMKAEKKLNDFMKQDRIMDDVLKKQRDNLPITFLPGDALEKTPRIELDDFVPFGVGPKIVASSAISLVYHYVQKDGSREIVSWWVVDEPSANKPEHKFRAHVWIQGSCLPGVVTGPLMTSPENAKKAAFMETCRLLFEAGALDDHLLPK